MNHREMVNAIVQRVFPRRVSLKSCEEELCNSVCQSLGKCYVAEKSEKQLAYVLSSASTNLFLQACPGSGKTEVVGLKSAYEFHAWEKKHSGIAILTFTKNAADVIRNRVHQYAGVEKSAYPHFIGTLDSWLHGYLAHPFGDLITGYAGQKNDRSIRLVEDDASGDWLFNYRYMPGYWHYSQNSNVLKSMPLYANKLRYDAETNLWEIKRPLTGSSEYLTDQDYYDSNAFQAYKSDKPWLTLARLRKDLSVTKERFLRDGFATYHDIEWICYQVLKEKHGFADRLAKRFPFIIVDECQDFSWIQLEILGLIKLAGSTLHFVGDLNQSIYEFKKVEPQKVKDFVAKYEFMLEELSDNFRSCQSIVDLCCKLVSGGSVIGKELPPVGPACVGFYYERKAGMSDLPKRFETYLEEQGVDVKKSAVLTRGWATVYKLQALDKGRKTSPQDNLTMAIYLWSQSDRRLWADAVRYIGKFVSTKYFKSDHVNSRHYYCPESVRSPTQWRLFLARVLDACLKSDHGISNLEQTWTSWAECVRKHFGQIIDSCLPALRNVVGEELTGMQAIDEISFKALPGSKDKKVLDTFIAASPQNHRIKVTTIHSVKGETFDAILLVSSPDQRGGKGGFWTEWLADPASEHARFAYVASSRPRKLLAWAIPIPDKSDKNLNRMTDIGFSVLDTAS